MPLTPDDRAWLDRQFRLASPLRLEARLDPTNANLLAFSEPPPAPPRRNHEPLVIGLSLAAGLAAVAVTCATWADGAVPVLAWIATAVLCVAALVAIWAQHSR